MSLTLVSNPAPNKVNLFAGFNKIEYLFKREDSSIISVTSGVNNKALITLNTDLTSILDIGDKIYIYSNGITSSYTYDGVYEILSITPTEITIDKTFVEVGTGGYINYLKNYYVEMQLVDKSFPDAELLPFSLESDGDKRGVITIDVSIINDLNQQREGISKKFLKNSVQEFEVKYRAVYEGSSNPFTLLNNKLLVVLYCLDLPKENEILNKFDLPMIYLGYPAALIVANSGFTDGDLLEIKYDELDINKNIINNDTLGIIDSNNGFFMWEWDKDIIVDSSTRFINFTFRTQGVFDFADPDFADPDFVTQ